MEVVYIRKYIVNVTSKAKRQTTLNNELRFFRRQGRQIGNS
jgi:hypothetical protein